MSLLPDSHYSTSPAYGDKFLSAEKRSVCLLCKQMALLEQLKVISLCTKLLCAPQGATISGATDRSNSGVPDQ